jgi:prolipoprotein diacylglyceryl transferase
VNVLSLIPSPSTGVLQLGPLRLNAYGAMIALGVVAAVWLSGRRLEKCGAGTREDMSAIAMWGVPAGVIGGRIYHVITDWELFRNHPERIVQIWKGGLGIWGGIFLGVVVGIWEGRRRGIATSVLLTCVAPALPLAQSIGRWGNWFNQELFGRPTTLPWALEVSDFRTKQAGYPIGTLFHPTFLYESLACLALCGLLLLLDKLVKRPGYLFLYYTAGYTLFRFFIEGLRIDPAHSAGGLRLNQWVSLVVFTVSVSKLALSSRTKSELPA